MSVQTIKKITESHYHEGVFTVLLSCGCEYTRRDAVHVGELMNCIRCPVTVKEESDWLQHHLHVNPSSACHLCKGRTA